MGFDVRGGLGGRSGLFEGGRFGGGLEGVIEAVWICFGCGEGEREESAESDDEGCSEFHGCDLTGWSPCMWEAFWG